MALINGSKNLIFSDGVNNRSDNKMKPQAVQHGLTRIAG